jgi:hypothetical protein
MSIVVSELLLTGIVSKVSSSSKSKEVEKIIMHDGFGYFLTHND